MVPDKASFLIEFNFVMRTLHPGDKILSEKRAHKFWLENGDQTIFVFIPVHPMDRDESQQVDLIVILFHITGFAYVTCAYSLLAELNSPEATSFL